MGCIDNGACVNVAYCNYTGDLTKSYCVGALTLNPGTTISECINGINYLCANLYCTTNNIGSYCTDKVRSLGTLPVSCSVDRDCKSTSDRFVGGFYIGSCICGNNALGTSYCSLFPGDPPFDLYNTVLSS